MFTTLPKDYHKFQIWSWAEFQPYGDDLTKRKLTASNLTTWLSDWSDLSRVIQEMNQRLYVGITVSTTDQEMKQRYNAFLDDIYPQFQVVNQQCKEKLLATGIEPDGMRVPLMHMRAEAAVYREANLPFLVEEFKLSSQYDEIIAAQTVTWEGKEYTLAQLQPFYQHQQRALREQVWRLGIQRQLMDLDRLNNLWIQLMDLRGKITANTGLPDYRTYIWNTLHRYDYTPQDCYSFHAAIEQEVVPVMRRIYEKRRQRLGVESLRPWDTFVDPLGRPALKPYQTVQELEDKASVIIQRVDPVLGKYFDLMRHQGLLDLGNRKGKAPGAYCTSFDVVNLPFIFENAVGMHEDVQTLLHEAGHAFHVFEMAYLPYQQQLTVGIEMSEVASTAMELLSTPYLTADQGGFYTLKEAARAQIEQLEGMILFWPYMAVVDAFQHWVYENHTTASQPANCNAKWGELWQRYMVGVDYQGLEEYIVTGWQRRLHIFEVPFYYIEYGLAQLGAMQIWRNAQNNQAEAVAAYRRALALGETVPLPELYAAAGARFTFDAEMLGEMVCMADRVIEELEQVK
jgi:oligoendopeptidase F